MRKQCDVLYAYSTRTMLLSKSVPKSSSERACVCMFVCARSCPRFRPSWFPIHTGWVWVYESIGAAAEYPCPDLRAIIVYFPGNGNIMFPCMSEHWTAAITVPSTTPHQTEPHWRYWGGQRANRQQTVQVGQNGQDYHRWICAQNTTFMQIKWTQSGQLTYRLVDLEIEANSELQIQSFRFTIRETIIHQVHWTSSRPTLGGISLQQLWITCACLKFKPLLT